MLSLKQKKFCEYYVELGNASQAAIKAGYSAKDAKRQGSRLLTVSEIRAYIEELTKADEKRRMASAEEVLEFFAEVMRNKEEATKNRLKAAENLAKRLGLDKEKAQGTEDKEIQVILSVENLSGGEE